MRYIWQHIQTITGSYAGDVPLAHYLKNHFRQHPKLGSRDRKIISEMCYSWYRCKKGIAAGNLSFEETMGLCLYLCGSTSKHVQSFIPAHLRDTAQQNIDLHSIFPFDISLSNGINTTEWLQSILTQPRLFIRTRKDRSKIITILKEHELQYETMGDHCIALTNGAQIDKILPADSYVVQDHSSQRTGAYFKPQKNDRWYDCCSGAGGKSLLLKDIEPAVNLTVTDRRQTILHNLEQRFRLYHHKPPVAHIADVSNASQLKTMLGNETFNGIICDVPCTGSGTWARTPEQLYFFDPSKLAEITTLQATIATNAAAYLKPSGRFVYITCSIFRQENEDVVAETLKRTSLVAEEMQCLNGIGVNADSMFVAVLKNNG